MTSHLREFVVLMRQAMYYGLVSVIIASWRNDTSVYMLVARSMYHGIYTSLYRTDFDPSERAYSPRTMLEF